MKNLAESCQANKAISRRKTPLVAFQLRPSPATGASNAHYSAKPCNLQFLHRASDCSLPLASRLEVAETSLESIASLWAALSIDAIEQCSAKRVSSKSVMHTMV